MNLIVCGRSIVRSVVEDLVKKGEPVCLWLASSRASNAMWLYHSLPPTNPETTERPRIGSVPTSTVLTTLTHKKILVPSLPSRGKAMV